MTLSATYEPRRQQGNGITKEFSYSFDPYSLEALKVYIEENGIQTETQDYTATANENGGIVTFNVAPTSEQYVVIARSVPQDQEVPFYTSSGFDAGVVENSLDKLTAMVQEVSNETLRSAKLPKGYNIDLELPVPEAGKGLYWNNEGTGFQNSRLNLDDVESLTKSYRDQSLAARDEAVASSNRAVTAVNEATELLNNTQTYVDEAKTVITNTRDEAVNTINTTSSTAVSTIETTVDNAKSDINTTIDEAQMNLSDTITQAVEDVKAEAVAAAEGAIQGAADTAIQIATDHTNTVIKPELQTYVDSTNANATVADNAATVSRTWATGTDEEVQAIEDDEHSSRTYANFAMALANTAEDVPVLESTLLATNVIQGEPWAGGEVTTPLTLVSDDNHPIAIRGMAGASATGYQIIDSNGLGESDFEHYATGDRYGTRITNKNNTSGTTSNIDFYQSNAGRSVLDLSEVQTILAPALLGAMYPVGSIYITTNTTCPIADLGVGTWELVAEDRVLQGAGTRGTVGTELAESLPNITGNTGYGFYNTGGQAGGSFYEFTYQATGAHPSSEISESKFLAFDASLSSSTYQDNAPVQQDAYLVNIFRRIQ